jgi:hypothetical protein
MKNKIIRAEELPEGANVFLKKDGKNYRVVHPFKNEDGSWNWFNFFTGGSWKNIIIVAVIVIIILGLLYEYSNNLQTLLDCFKDQINLEICKKSFGENLTTIDFIP